MRSLKLLACLSYFLFSACAFQHPGMLVQFSGTVTPSGLKHFCDLEDTATCYLAGKPLAEPVASYAVIQGAAPPGKAVFSVLLDRSQSPHWYLFERETSTISPLAVSRVHARPGSQYRLEQLEATDLKEGGAYELIAVDSSGKLMDAQRFRPLAFGANPFRFALVSCADDRFLQEQEGMWKSLLQEMPQLVLAIGDNTYADSRGGAKFGQGADPDTLWERYAETRNALAVFRSSVLVPFFAVWDDHDFGMNDGDRTYPHAEEAREVMEAFFPVIADARRIFEGPGVSKALLAGEQAFILFDDRSFRSPNGLPSVCRKSTGPLCRGSKQPENSGSTHFGRMQEEWALRLLEKQDRPVWLISGDQWFGDYPPFESFEGNHPASFSQFQGKLTKSVKAAARAGRHPSLLFASGDRHLTEVMKVRPLKGLRYETMEFTSSAIHAKTFPNAWKDFPNPRQIVGDSGVLNFTVLESRVKENGALELNARAIGPGRRILYERNFTVTPAIPTARR